MILRHVPPLCQAPSRRFQTKQTRLLEPVERSTFFLPAFYPHLRAGYSNNPNWDNPTRSTTSHPTPTIQSAAMSWQPQQEGLNEVLTMLRQTSSSDSEVQRAVTQVRIIFKILNEASECVHVETADHNLPISSFLHPDSPYSASTNSALFQTFWRTSPMSSSTSLRRRTRTVLSPVCS